MIGRMCSSVVGHMKLNFTTEVKLGFQVTCDRDRNANRLKACTSFSKPGSGCSSGMSCGTSANARLIGAPRASVRSARSSFKPTQRFASSLAPVGGAGLLRCCEWIETFAGPVIEHRLEGGADLTRRKIFEQVDAGALHRRVVRAGVQIDRGVVIDGADYIVEIDPAVEKTPGHIAHQRA